MRCSLIVLNYNGAGVVEGCVESLLAAAGPDDEVIVVDNASADGSLQVLQRQFPQVRYVVNARNRYIFGLNDGLAVAQGEFVAFLNNDMTVEPGFVENSMVVFDAPDVFAVCPRIKDAHGEEQGSRTSGFWKQGLFFYRALPHSEEPTDCFFAVGGQSFYRRSGLDEIGSIDELLWPMYHEDIELSYRAWKRGWRVRYAPDAVAHHLGGHTSKKVFTPVQLRSFVRQNEYLTVWKNVTDRRMLGVSLLLLGPRLLVALARRDWGTLRGFGRAASRLPQVRLARAEAKRCATLTDAEVLRRVSAIR